MARVIIDGRKVHPDELRDGAAPSPAAPDPARLEADRLTAAGYRRDPAPSHWWTAPDGTRLQGRARALAHLS